MMEVPTPKNASQLRPSSRNTNREKSSVRSPPPVGLEGDDVSTLQVNNLRHEELDGDAQSGAAADWERQFDPKLVLVMKAWVTLPEPIKESILATICQKS